MYGGVGQERFDPGFEGEEVLSGAQAVETNTPHDPVHVRSLGDASRNLKYFLDFPILGEVKSKLEKFDFPMEDFLKP
ncbi:MAG: hypothetical protein HY730_06200 [Candidatus Tectomicrobia bacterium]|uniref:Uncharacterized protein n=1 Tax=Tectimicrobiota bacterium TaxID=2528274 RepID=A0A933GNU9_UNCTE|nr:hypothetical protein [Candidatus Tectomicrobia bacterium]